MRAFKTTIYQDHIECLGRRLASLRKTVRLSRYTVATAIGVSESTIKHWECGEQAMPAVRIVPLCRVLGCTPNTLVGYEEGCV